MFRPRVIPCLLLKDNGLVKTIKFENPNYIGDPLNAIRIFNMKEADELLLLNIGLYNKQFFFNRKRSTIPFELINKISQECLMPLSYGGGINNISDINKLFKIGVEKVAVNTAFFKEPSIVKEASEIYGSQSIIVSIDAKKNGEKYAVYSHCGKILEKLSPRDAALLAEEMGAGEILINSIDQDGCMSGYDLDLLKEVSSAVNIPVIACGGAGKLEDLKNTYNESGVSALAAGSLFVYFGKKRGVLINYPSNEELDEVFKNII